MHTQQAAPQHRPTLGHQLLALSKEVAAVKARTATTAVPRGRQQHAALRIAAAPCWRAGRCYMQLRMAAGAARTHTLTLTRARHPLGIPIQLYMYYR